MPSRKWYTVAPNTSQSQPIDLNTSSFTLSAPPKTDIWRPSPTEDVFSAPYIYTSIRTSTFKSLAVTVSADWKTLYDQGGLLILWPGQGDDFPKNKRRWVKTGIEFFEGKPALSVVGCDRLSDWSLSPLPSSLAGGGASRARVQAERKGDTLWVYFVDEASGEKHALREIKWAFHEPSGNTQGDEEMWVGVAVAKPTPDEGDASAEVKVEFRDLVVDA